MSKKNEFLARYGHSDHLHHVIDTNNGDYFYRPEKEIADNSISNPAVNHHHITKLLDSEHMGVRKLAAMNDHINDDHVAKIMGNNDYGQGDVKRAVMLNDNVKPHALKKAFDNGGKETREIIGKSTFLPKELRHHVLANSHDAEINKVVKSRIENDKGFDDFMDSIKDDDLLKH